MIKQSVTVICKTEKLENGVIRVEILEGSLKGARMGFSSTPKVVGKKNIPIGKYQVTYTKDDQGEFITTGGISFKKFPRGKLRGASCIIPYDWHPQDKEKEGTRFNRTIKILREKGEKNA